MPQTKRNQVDDICRYLKECECLMTLQPTRWPKNQQLQQFRKELRGFNSYLFMGKKSLVKIACKQVFGDSNWHAKVMNKLAKGEAGILFITKESSVIEIATLLRSYSYKIPIQKGKTCSEDVILPRGPTGLNPTQTGGLRCYGIPTKISKGQIEVISDVKIFEQGRIFTEADATMARRFSLLEVHSVKIQAVVNLKETFEYPPVYYNYTWEKLSHSITKASWNIRTVDESLALEVVDESDIILTELDMREFETAESVQKFQTVKQQTHCPFAKRAKVWGNRILWDNTKTFESNCERIFPDLKHFLKHCEEQLLDAFVLEATNAPHIANTIDEFIKREVTLLELYQNFGKCLDTPCNAGFYNICGIPCFVSSFAPCCPPTSSRFMFTTEETKNSCFWMFQPESSFIRRRLIDPQNRIKDLSSPPPVICNQIRSMFETQGRSYIYV